MLAIHLHRECEGKFQRSPSKSIFFEQSEFTYQVCSCRVCLFRRCYFQEVATPDAVAVNENRGDVIVQKSDDAEMTAADDENQMEQADNNHNIFKRSNEPTVHTAREPLGKSHNNSTLPSKSNNEKTSTKTKRKSIAVPGLVRIHIVRNKSDENKRCPATPRVNDAVTSAISLASSITSAKNVDLVDNVSCGVVKKEPNQDRITLQEYLETNNAVIRVPAATAVVPLQKVETGW
ncbi:uncharacterized protein LOC143912591 [Arctopsyche grandis]|uniref:uncharacterized protein LOC143912591 n=1 Tax=Arctopsyche grandis TaxID=121162 RepID=UPI00406D9188